MSTGLCRLAASGPAARPGKRVGRQPTQDSHSTPYFRPMTWLPGKGSEVDKILPTGRHVRRAAFRPLQGPTLHARIGIDRGVPW